MTSMLGLLSVPYREAATRYTHTRLRGACEFGASVPEWPQDHIQLSSGLFIGECETISLDNLLLIREVTNQSLIKSGYCWPGSVVLSLPLQASGNAWTGGHSIDAPCGLLSSGANLPEVITPTALDLVSVVFDQHWFAHSALMAGHHELGQRIWRHESMVLAPAPLLKLQHIFKRSFCTIGTAPGILDDGHVRMQIEHEITSALIEAFQSARTVEPMRDTPHKVTADAARGLILSSQAEQMDIEEICKVLRVSRRHLQNCFQRSYGQSAIQFAKAIRLNRVRKSIIRLARQDPSCTIGDIASDHGFWHLSRFAGEYAKHFGELPSQTLMKIAPRPPTRVNTKGRS